MKRSPLWENLFSRKNKAADESLEFMKNTPVFEDLSNREIKIIRSLCHVRHYKKDEHVFREGEPGVGMYIIMEGSVEIYRSDEDYYREYAVLEQGDFFGEIALLDDLPRTASARARSYSVLLGFYRPDLLSLLSRKSSLAGTVILNIARLTGQRLVHTNQEMERLNLRIDELKRDRKQPILARSAVKKKPE